jgi:hypothetical protein
LRRDVALPRVPRRHVLALAGLAALTVFLFHEAVLGGRVLFARDIGTWWVPQVESLVRCVFSGSWPVWHPWRGVGQPLLADPSTAVFYPPTWINLLAAPWVAQTLLALFHFMWSGAGLYTLALRWGASPPAAFVGASLWIASPLLALDSTSHFAGAAWMPWVFVAGEAALERPSFRRSALWGVVMALQIAAGSADMVAMTWMAYAAAACVFHLRFRADAWADNRAVLAAGLGAAALAVGLTAAQWAPTLEIAARSERFALAASTRTTWSLHPAALLELLLPIRWADLPLRPHLTEGILGGKEPWLVSIYLGLPALALVAAAFAEKASRRTLFLLALGVVAVLVALGSHAPFYRALVFLVPPLRILRFPMKALMVGGLAWSCLAALGWDLWRRGENARRFQRVVLPVAVAAGALVLLAAALVLFGTSAWAPQILLGWDEAVLAGSRLRMAGAAGVALVSLALLAARTLRPDLAPRTAAALAAVTVVSLAAFQVRFHPTAHRELFTRRPPVLEHLGKEPRVYAYDYTIATASDRARGAPAVDHFLLARWPQGWTRLEGVVLGVHEYLNPPTAARWGVRASYDPDLLGLYDPPLAEVADRVRDPRLSPTLLRRLMQMGGVTHVLALHDAPSWAELEPRATVPSLFREPIRVFGVPETLPAVWAVGEAVVADTARALEIAAGDGFDPKRTAILGEGAPLAGAGWRGRAPVAQRKPDRVRVETDFSGPGLVLVLDGYDAGWRAAVDGAPAAIRRANIAFFAVEVPAGRHVVECVYRPPGLRIGLAVSALAALLALAALARP